MNLSKRLRIIADCVKYGTLADIGCDHGFLPIYLCETGRIRKAAACDVNKNPLKLAERNIREHGFEEYIETRSGNGLSPVKPGEFETCVIAGMGGVLIIEILRNEPEIAGSFRQLILSPQKSVYKLREFLLSGGYGIADERMVFENETYYNIICAEPDGRAANGRPYDERELLFGRILIDKKDETLINYLRYEINRTELLITRICRDDRPRSSAHLDDYLLRCQTALQEVTECP